MSAADAPDPRPCDVDDANPERGERGEGTGLPDEATIISETTMTSPTGRRYRIVRTRQTDAYDRSPPEREAEPDEGQARDCSGAGNGSS